jgi:4-amino-4-deoxy-L-arabinose transferase-like glycosyltransferase
VTRTRIAGVLLLLLLVWFTGLEARKLIRPDEGRYAEIPREMSVSGDWVTPRLNGPSGTSRSPPAAILGTALRVNDTFGLQRWTARALVGR